uniref:Uncharacterized protein n=1 Tax=Arundo donax TaxID=35708 RepID=A0A0A9ACP1_ARUDO
MNFKQDRDIQSRKRKT